MRRLTASQLMAFADHVYAASEPDEHEGNSTYCEQCGCRITAGRCKHGVMPPSKHWNDEHDSGQPIPDFASKPEDTMTAEDRKEQLEPDYEPEQAYGTADDFRRHRQYGGTREDY